MGYLTRNLNWPVRIILVASGIAMVDPGMVTDMAGIVCILVIVAYLVISGKKAPSASEPPNDGRILSSPQMRRPSPQKGGRPALFPVLQRHTGNAGSGCIESKKEQTTLSALLSFFLQWGMPL